MRYEQSHFYDELEKMLAEAKTSGKTTLRVISQDLYDRAVHPTHRRVSNPDDDCDYEYSKAVKWLRIAAEEGNDKARQILFLFPDDNFMKPACRAMWWLWGEQGYQKRKIVNAVDREGELNDESGMIELEFDTY